jgi:hypothetical protein
MACITRKDQCNESIRVVSGGPMGVAAQYLFLILQAVHQRNYGAWKVLIRNITHRVHIGIGKSAGL